MALLLLGRGIGLLALGAGLLFLHRRRWRNRRSFGLQRMNDAIYLFAAVPVLLFALLAIVEGITGTMRLGLRARAQSFLSGLHVACKRDRIDVSNPTDSDGWVRIANVDGNGGPVVIDLDGGDHFDPARRAYADPPSAFLLAPRTTRSVKLSRPSNAVECHPKYTSVSTGAQLPTSIFLIDPTFFGEPCDTWHVTLISALSEQGAKGNGDGGVVIDCPITP